MKIPQNIRAVIFDLDGLLIDSEPYWEKGDRKLLRDLGVLKFDQEKLKKKMLGRGMKECAKIFIREFKLKLTSDEFIKMRWEHLYRLLMKNLRLMPGVKKLVGELYKKKFILAVATGGHKKENEAEILKQLKLFKYFKLIVSGMDVARSKPHPDIYLETARRLEVEPELQVEPVNCLVLEDAPNGVLAGKRAGMITFGINPHAKLRKELKKARADWVFRSLEEISV